MKRRTFVKSVVPAAVAAMRPAAAAAAFPEKPVNLIVPYAAAGATDNVARPFAELLARHLGQRVLVENRPGVNGRIGTDWVAKSKPDGYNLLVGGIGPVTIAPHLEKLPYDAMRDLAPLSLLALAEEILVVNADLPVKDFRDLLGYLKKTGASVNFGSAGPASPNHMAGELLKSVAGVEMTHVPYKGDSAALVDLGGGSIQLMFATVSAALPFIQSGRVRVIAGAGQARPSAFQDVPTIAEQGFPDFSADVWIGLFGPTGLPKDTVATLSRAVAEAGRSEQLREAFRKQGMTPVGNSPEQFAQFVAAEYAKWGKVIRDRKLSTRS